MSEYMLAEILRKFGFLAVIIVLDIASGVTLAVKEGEFRLEKLPEFMKKYIPMIVGWLLAEAATVIPPDIYELARIPIPYSAFQSIGTIAYGVIFLGSLGSFLANLASVGLLKEWLEKFGFKK